MKKWYHELNLKQVFKEYEEECYKNIVELLSQKSGNLSEGLFLEFVKKSSNGLNEQFDLN